MLITPKSIFYEVLLSHAYLRSIIAKDFKKSEKLNQNKNKI